MKSQNKIRQVVVDVDEAGEVKDITYYLHGSTSTTEPFSILEFKKGTPTRKALSEIEAHIEIGFGFYRNLINEE